MADKYPNDKKPVRPAQSLPPLAEWPAGASAWLQLFGSFDHAEAFAALFWPRFITHDSSTFLDFDEKSYADWLAHLKGDKPRVEATMNHRHICDLLPCHEPEPTREQITRLGNLLRETWSAKLSRDFPGERFRVQFSEEYQEDLVDYNITFFHDGRPGN